MIHANLADASRSRLHLRYIATVVRLTLWEGLRARLPWLAGSLALSFWLLSRFLAQVSLIEAADIGVTVVGALTRLAAVFLTANFVVSSMARESADKVTDLLLSQPAPRWAYFAGRCSGFMLVSGALSVAIALPLWLQAPTGLPAWLISLVAEVMMVTVLSLLFSLTFAQPTAALSAIAGFYVLSRTIGTMQLMAKASLAHEHGWADSAVAWLLDGIALLMPGLDRLASASWLLVPPDWTELATLLSRAALYAGVLMAAALFDLYRKNY